jgi:hypothetical protein
VQSQRFSSASPCILTAYYNRRLLFMGSEHHVESLSLHPRMCSSYGSSSRALILAGWLIGEFAGTKLVDRAVRCAKIELAVFAPAKGQTCAAYLQNYFQAAALGALYNTQASHACQYCLIRNSDQFVTGESKYPSDQYRTSGIPCAYIAFNMLAATTLHNLLGVRRVSSRAVFTRKGADTAQARQGRPKGTARSLAAS